MLRARSVICVGCGTRVGDPVAGGPPCCLEVRHQNMRLRPQSSQATSGGAGDLSSTNGFDFEKNGCSAMISLVRASVGGQVNRLLAEVRVGCHGLVSKKKQTQPSQATWKFEWECWKLKLGLHLQFPVPNGPLEEGAMARR